MAAPEIILGTSGGNKTLTAVHVGTSGGNKQATEVWIGTASGNKLVLGGADVTPAAVNWANITGGASGSNAAQGITGINTSISIAFARTGGSGSGSVSAQVNGGALQGSPITVSNADDVEFIANANPGGYSGTVTVTNQSDGAAVLDTFTISLTG